jgi:hypothetical protein
VGFTASCAQVRGFVESRKGHRLVGHGGRWQGCSTHIARYLDDGLTIVILTNQANCNPQLIVDEVAAVYLAKWDSR